ncbi:MAG: NAD-dependent epimerase/dehydratase family protein [Polyangiaceae bacterium]|nr:NAD-dependent epimerase/dehydratase family protein [Polyangiaceae bacterium]
MRCLVTGVAGFVGSTLAERLVSLGHDVLGVDCFTDYYARSNKEENLAALRAGPRFGFEQLDLATADLVPIVSGADAVFHQAAQAGVRASWGKTFETYTSCNVLATQRLLEAAKNAGTVERFVYASSSSVYGDTTDLPMRETSRPRPFSPYGVTKLAAEHLAELYRENFGVPTVSLRYFTVYGPRQRPDMGFHRFIARLLRGEPLPVYGDGEQTRDFTFIEDIVEANLQSLNEGASGVYNIGGGSRVTLNDVLVLLAELTGQKMEIARGDKQAGDVRHTAADTTRAETELGYKPKVGLREGLARQVEWMKAHPQAWG